MGWDEDRADDSADLLEKVRAGDDEAFGEFWMQHHARVARYVARRAPDMDAEDIASAVLEATGSALRSGHGPTHAVHGYLYSAARSEIGRRRNRAERERALLMDQADLSHHVHAGAGPAPSPEGRRLLQDVIASFPAADARLLTALQVEDHDMARIGRHVGLQPAQVSRRIYKLRPRVQQRWVQAHVDAAGLRGEHADMLAHAGQVLSGQASPAVRRAFEDHVARCRQCAGRIDEARTDSRTLALLLPALFPVIEALDDATALGLGGSSSGGAGGGAAGAAGTTAAGAGGISPWIVATTASAAAVLLGGVVALTAWLAPGTDAVAEAEPAVTSSTSTALPPVSAGTATAGAGVASPLVSAAGSASAATVPAVTAPAASGQAEAEQTAETTSSPSGSGTGSAGGAAEASGSATNLTPCSWSSQVLCYSR